MSGKYRDYDVVVGEDFPRDCHYRDDALDRGLLRVHYRVTRLPSQKLITLRHLRDASPTERAAAERKLPHLSDTFALWEARTNAVRRGRYAQNTRCAIFVVMCGTPVEDPLVQLELEMMIDQGAIESQPEWLSESETASTLGVTVSDLAAMREQRTGPRYYKPSLRTVVYARDEVDLYRVGGIR